MTSNFLQLPCLVRTDFDIQKSLTEGFPNSGALNWLSSTLDLICSYPLSRVVRRPLLSTSQQISSDLEKAIILGLSFPLLIKLKSNQWLKKQINKHNIFQENTGKEQHQINFILYENHIKIWLCMATQVAGRLRWNKGVCLIWKLPPGNTEWKQKEEGINYRVSSTQQIKPKTKKSWTQWCHWEFCHWPCRKPSFQPGRTSAELSFISVLTALLAASPSLNTTFKHQDKAEHQQHHT